MDNPHNRALRRAKLLDQISTAQRRLADTQHRLDGLNAELEQLAEYDRWDADNWARIERRLADGPATQGQLAATGADPSAIKRAQRERKLAPIGTDKAGNLLWEIRG